MSKKFLLSAIFAAGAVGAPAVAGDMQVLNEEELEEVSAQGFQQVVNDTRNYGGSANQNNNLDSVQMNGNAQQSATGADLVAAATSSVNVAINILWSDAQPEVDKPVIRDGSTPPYSPVLVEGPNAPEVYGNAYDQNNEQTAHNHKNVAGSLERDDDGSLIGSVTAEAYNKDKETQSIDNYVYPGSTVAGQDNNNNSVQLNDNAQQNATGLAVENSAQSASNIGLNVFASGVVQNILGTQSNTQSAENMNNEAYALESASAYNGESSEATQTVVNNAPETGEINVHDQDNNNNSVQLNGAAQQNATGITINNNANSAKNFGVNIHYSEGVITESAVSQTNEQEAGNHNNTAQAPGDAEAYNRNKERQVVITPMDEVSEFVNVSNQNNNNNSVQLNDDAQQNATGLEIRNSALSAYNTGMNIMKFDSSSSASLSQTNEQTAGNMNNNAEGLLNASAYNGEWVGENDVTTQYVQIQANVSNQNNNNNSVQLNGNAQENAAALTMVNNANSAQNSGMNILVDLITPGDDTTPPPSEKGISDTGVNQINNQTAENHVNTASAKEGEAFAGNVNKQSQEIRNAEEVDNRAAQIAITDNSNNNNSVQLNDNAQRNAKAFEMVNMAVSAANTGINVAVFHSVTNSGVTQTNNQTARNFENTAIGNTIAKAVNGELSENPGQYVHNVHARIEGQDNNNNSVQLNDNAQEKASGFSIANIAKVALNSGVNIIWIENATSDSEITQTNTQYAGNHNNTAIASESAIAMNENKQTQVIENCYCADIVDQNNNQNSVQLNDNAQANVTGWHVLNGATSAVNMATNIMTTRGAVSGTVLTQTNSQTAVNFSNTAMGTNATAGNLR